MEVDAWAPVAPAPRLPAAAGAHVCDSSCTVVHCFGNVYKCQTSGLVHVCDHNCDQQVDWNREERICRCSRKLSPRTGFVSDSHQRCAYLASSGRDQRRAGVRAATGLHGLKIGLVSRSRLRRPPRSAEAPHALRLREPAASRSPRGIRDGARVQCKPCTAGASQMVLAARCLGTYQHRSVRTSACVRVALAFGHSFGFPGSR